MAKFYCQTAAAHQTESIKFVVDRVDSMMAACEFWWRLRIQDRQAEVGDFIFVNETGFDTEPDQCIETPDVVERVTRSLGMED